MQFSDVAVLRIGQEILFQTKQTGKHTNGSFISLRNVQKKGRDGFMSL